MIPVPADYAKNGYVIPVPADYAKNGYVIPVPADYAKNLNQILGLLIRNMMSKNVNLLCFTTFF